MRRGDLYRVPSPLDDPRRARVYVVISRDQFLSARYSMAACVPIYSSVMGLETEVIFDVANGLKHLSAARCDEVTSVQRSVLRDFIGFASEAQLTELSRALAIALGISPADIADV